MDHLRIPVGNDLHLSARVWLPTDAAQSPVPAVIEYIPFRYTDFTAPRDQLIHPWFAGHGYASIRLELRGSGDSTGMPMDEYVPEEQQDALAALAWIGAQPWCNGNIGMFGMSWGAFSALQVAALRPPQLKAIIAVHGTDDRYRDDVHYMGGCLLLNNLSWGSQYQAYMARPPNPRHFGSGWREAWLQRLQQAPLVLEDWIGHQARDHYWQQGSVAQDHGAIECATYIVGGWADGYAAAAMRMAEHLSAPKRIVIGPWAHTYPHIARPGPRIGFLQDATRWWDRWLKHVPNGIDREATVQLWLRDHAPPATDYGERPGRWLGFDGWPAPEVQPHKLWLNARGRLTQAQGAPLQSAIRSRLDSAIRSGEWLPHGVGPEMPPDQRDEDRHTLTFDGPKTPLPLEVCGQACVKLRVKVDQPTAHIYARLSVLRPDGKVTRMTHGLLNLAFREGFGNSRIISPGEWMDIELPLIEVAERVPAGHQLRLSLGTQAWPLAWPAPARATLVVAHAHSSLDIPVLRQTPKAKLTPFESPAAPQALDLDWLKSVKRERSIFHNPRQRTVTRRYLKDDGHFTIAGDGVSLATSAEQLYQIGYDDPLSAKAQLKFAIALKNGNWRTRITCYTKMQTSQTHFRLDGRIELSEAGNTVAVREIDATIPRTTA